MNTDKRYIAILILEFIYSCYYIVDLRNSREYKLLKLKPVNFVDYAQRILHIHDAVVENHKRRFSILGAITTTITHCQYIVRTYILV